MASKLRHPYYDRRGRPIDVQEWGRLFGRYEYKTVALSTVLAESSALYRIHTAWIGLDHGWNPELPPVIFETMVFVDDVAAPAGDDKVSWAEEYTERYCTEAEAVVGHSKVEELIRQAIAEIGAEHDVVPDPPE